MTIAVALIIILMDAKYDLMHDVLENRWTKRWMPTIKKTILTILITMVVILSLYSLIIFTNKDSVMVRLIYHLLSGFIIGLSILRVKRLKEGDS